jgi:polygalacturonase
MRRRARNGQGVLVSDRGRAKLATAARAVVEPLECRRLLTVIPPLPVIPDQTFNVMSYGAVGNGTTEDTTAIQDAINAAGAAGGGTVLLPAGKTFLSNFLSVKSNNINIEINGTLLAEPYGSYTKPSDSLITFDKVDNVELSGTGTINGQGGVGVNGGWWGDSLIGISPVSTRPRLVRFTGCNVVEVLDITLVNSPSINIIFGSLATNNVTCDDVQIYAPSSDDSQLSPGEIPSHNTDGIDPAGNNYLIENCIISNGDDNIAVTAENVACSNITIEDCTFGTGHGVSIGGSTNFGVKNVLVYNCTFNGTTNGVRLKAQRGNGGIVSNITYSHLTMTNVEIPIVVDSYYNGSNNFPTNPASDPGEPVTSTTPFWRNIVYADITATGATDAGYIVGLPEAPVQNVTLMNVDIAATNGLVIYHARNVYLTGSTSITASSGDPFTTYDATVFSRLTSASGNSSLLGATAVASTAAALLKST